LQPAPSWTKPFCRCTCVQSEAADSHEAKRLSRELEPNVLLLGLNMPGPSAFETVAYLREHCPQVKVVMLTAHSDDAYVHGLVAAGRAMCSKMSIEEAVVRAIRVVMQGGAWFSKPIVEKLAQLAANEAPPVEQPALTKRELEVLKLVARGYTNIQIGETLSISERTVRFHLRNICDKIGVRSRVEAAIWAGQHGLTHGEGDDLKLVE